MSIDNFRGRNFFLSNFYNHPVFFEGITYQNNEAAFQAAKLPSNNTRDKKTKLFRRAFADMEPNEAKRFGRKVALRPDWDFIRVDVMREILNDKFSSATMAKKLLATGNERLVEGNTWNDKFWGVDSVTGEGENNLGKLLMEIRNDLKGRN